MARPQMTQEEFIARVSEKFPYIDFSTTTYHGAMSSITFSCDEHGNQRFTRASKLLGKKENPCPACARAYAAHQNRGNKHNPLLGQIGARMKFLTPEQRTAHGIKIKEALANKRSLGK